MTFKSLLHFCTSVRSQRKRPALLQEHSAGCGILLHFCGNIPLPAETPCTFATAIRWLRKRPAFLQGHSADKRCLQHFCRSIDTLLFGANLSQILHLTSCISPLKSQSVGSRFAERPFFFVKVLQETFHV